MISAVRVKLALAVVGVAAFFFGIRIGSNTLRLAGIVLVAAGWLMRFWPNKETARGGDQPPSESR